MRSSPPVQGCVNGIREGGVATVGVGVGVEAGATIGASVSNLTAVALSPPPQKLAPHVVVRSVREPGPMTRFFSIPSLSTILHTAQSFQPMVRQILS